ncbi:MAG: bifunctional DNA-formamidopyrimidine glycosylase/DNA-(apurinic or apyrimidinic site) lyase [Candidatus Sungbacteria bacterium]|uniref:Bifunctional DNA-formamidopyrimidine glycosylase/DNA-(Apurinic or apyrimidinic site) lyase n=1 Tax=Candidatus Sungiibacteriota bacterium TaxID=2750080 RepID=A0A932YWN7_9BACT|nr:bifunctional DNA-formamidopyrimidine glycosylase/DNA-(apurinic or apyrimidinic site) lyase [Candidatus Sungbacteria bacterium]
MPELPEVEITRRKLLPALKSQRILDFWTDWPRGLRLANRQELRRDITGRSIRNVQRRGKVLFFELSGLPRRILAIHLRMSGRLEVSPSGRKFRRSTKFASPEPARRWTHFRWRLSGGRELRFVDPRKFGLVWYGDERELRQNSYLASLGDDARDIAARRFLGALASRRGMIKPLLLRQDVFAGIGNIIADEALWWAKIHPQQELAGLPPRDRIRLHRAVRETIRVMLAAGGTTLRNWGHPDGRTGHYQERRLVYGKSGQPCPRCRSRLLRLFVGGRGTTICPKCQRKK